MEADKPFDHGAMAMGAGGRNAGTLGPNGSAFAPANADDAASVRYDREMESTRRRAMDLGTELAIRAVRTV
jgi:hypothetical protein